MVNRIVLDGTISSYYRLEFVLHPRDYRYEIEADVLGPGLLLGHVFERRIVLTLKPSPAPQ